MIDLAERAAQAATRVLSLRYPEAMAAFVAGSIMRGEGTECSDIDCVVLFELLTHARRESFVFEGFPVEAFIHDPQTLPQRFDAAFFKLRIDAEGSDVIALLEKEMDRHGGSLFDGYCRDAPALNRRVA